MGNKRYRVKKNWLDRLEVKFGKYAVPDLMKYMSIVYCIGFAITLSDTFRNTNFYGEWLALDIEAILHGQVWRIITFMLYPPVPFGNAADILWFAISIYLYLMIGRSLENAWGSFRFNAYYIGGMLFVVLGEIISQIVFGVSGFGGETAYLNLTMFLAFAVLYPNVEFLLFFIIPVKVKWLAILDAILIGYSVFSYIAAGISYQSSGADVLAQQCFAMVIIVVMSVANFLIFFSATKQYRKMGPKESTRTRKFKKKIDNAMKNTKHQCEVCGKTNEDDPDLEFRYCSKCDGNHEYCMEHLFTHEHVKRFTININKDEL